MIGPHNNGRVFITVELHAPIEGTLLLFFARETNFITEVRLEVFTAVTMKNGVFWDVTPCGFSKNRRLEELNASFIRVTRIDELGTTLVITS
jgi:hypothetical protein